MENRPEIRTKQIKEIPFPSYEGNYLTFENTKIQMDKSSWHFDEKDRTLDTYSIWNPNYHEEIAQRLKEGDRGAFYIMGNFGVVEIRKPEEKKDDVMFDKIKKRSRTQNFVAFMNPEDAIDLIDIDKMHGELRSLKWAGKRLNAYPTGPLHAVFPLKKHAEIDKGVVRKPDNTLAVFWIKGHWGFESLGDKLRKKVKRGVLGGGSLNIHNQEPSYDDKELYDAFSKNPEWQEEIDFIVFDEIAQEGKIGRSQTMISYASNPPDTLRVGSLSPQEIELQTGIPINFNTERYKTDSKYKASSQTKYNKRNDDKSNLRINNVMDKIQRYKEYYSKNLKKGFNF